MAAIAKLTADLELNSGSFRKELDKSQKQVGRFKKETKKADGKVVAFNRTMRGTAQGLAAINGPLNGVSSRFSTLNTIVSSGAGAWGLLGVGIAGASLLLAQANKQFEAVELQQLKLNQILKSTESAAGRTFAQLDKQARQVALATLASTDEIRNAQHVLLTFKSVQGDVFDRAIQLAQDYATTIGGQAKAAAMAFGKALEVPSEGLSKLTRQGVTFTAAEKALVVSLENAGRVAEAQGVILDKLAGQVGGVAEAAAGGSAGARDSLAQAWDEMLEAIARTTGVSDKAASSLNVISSNIFKINKLLDPSIEDQRIAKKKEIADIQEKINENDESFVGSLLKKAGVERENTVLLHKQNILKRELMVINESLMLQIEAEDRATIKSNEAKQKSLDLLAQQKEAKIKEAEDKKASKDAELAERELSREKTALESKSQALEVEHLSEQEKLVYHFEQRHEIIKRSHELEVISEQRKNELIQNEANKLNKELGAISDKDSKAENARKQAEFKKRLGYFSAMSGSLEQISQGSSKKLFKFSQDLSLGVAAVALPAAVVQAYQNGGGLPWAAFAAAATFTAGVAQIQSIRSARVGGGGGGSAPSSSISSSAPSIPSLESIAPGIDSDNQAKQGVTLVFNGPVSSNDVPKFANDLKEYLDVSDFVLVSSSSYNGLELK